MAMDTRTSTVWPGETWDFCFAGNSVSRAPLSLTLRIPHVESFYHDFGDQSSGAECARFTPQTRNLELHFIGRLFQRALFYGPLQRFQEQLGAEQNRRLPQK